LALVLFELFNRDVDVLQITCLAVSWMIVNYVW